MIATFQVPMKPRVKRSVSFTKSGIAYKSADYKQWKKDFASHCLYQGEPIARSVMVIITLTTKSGKTQGDVDNTASAILDAMQPTILADDVWVDCLQVSRRKGAGYAIHVTILEYVPADVTPAKAPRRGRKATAARPSASASSKENDGPSGASDEV